jgi:gamma-glutamylcyclotransferase (GGCT)/AIG2-like uncharacterized protein YtfP
MLYFAYGMNTNNNAMSKTSKRLGPATLLGYKWEMLQFANVFESKGDATVGILWDIDEAELQDLDYREGYPTFYDRVVANIEHDNQNKRAWVYYMTPHYRTKLTGCEPSQHYYDSVVEGYAQDGLVIS